MSKNIQVRTISRKVLLLTVLIIMLIGIFYIGYSLVNDCRNQSNPFGSSCTFPCKMEKRYGIIDYNQKGIPGYEQLGYCIPFYR